jgi:uncharacterized membrane protein YdbT with pleckstrin-like domain
MEPEVTIHQCTPSQIVNLKSFAFAALLAVGIIVLAIVTDTPILYIFLLLPLAWALWKWLEVKSTRFTLTDQRLIVSNGIFTKRTNETELYRVRDTSIEEPFFYRMFGVGT